MFRGNKMRGGAGGGSLLQRKKKLFVILGAIVFVGLLVWGLAANHQRKPSEKTKKVLSTDVRSKSGKLKEIKKTESLEEGLVEDDLDHEEDLDKKRKSLENEIIEGDATMTKLKDTLDDGRILEEEIAQDQEEVSEKLKTTTSWSEKRELRKDLTTIEKELIEVESINDEIVGQMEQLANEEDQAVNELEVVVEKELDEIANTKRDLKHLLHDADEKEEELLKEINAEAQDEMILENELAEDAKGGSVLGTDDRALIKSKIGEIESDKAELEHQLDDEEDKVRVIEEFIQNEDEREDQVLAELENLEEAMAVK